MYFLEADLPAREEPKLIRLPNGHLRPPDSVYLRAGRQPPSAMEMHLASSIRLQADRKLRRKTPQWIRDWANDPRYRNR